MSDKDVARALEMVAQAFREGSYLYGPEKVTRENLGDVVTEIERRAAVLRDAVGNSECVMTANGGCGYHPYGGHGCGIDWGAGG